MSPESAYKVDVRRLDEFSANALYEMLKLRVDVFVVEQACAYPELDGDDQSAHHLRLFLEGQLAGCARIFKPGENRHPRIGRVAIAVPYRGKRLGERLMTEAMGVCSRLFPDEPIEISAQSHLQRFYGSLGFRAISDEYVEDGIPHIDMLKEAS